jgi:galactose mutarotase-like enzyme
MIGDERHKLQNGPLSVEVKADGAELCSVKQAQSYAEGRELLWQAGPAWPRHAPVLFPIVGQLRDNRLRHRGQWFRMTQHGFARDRRFSWVERGPAACRLVLEDDAQSRACYPFAFRLELAYSLSGRTLRVGHTVTNTGDEVLPASLGAHPAFRWPLATGIAKQDHVLEFEREEPAPVRRLTHGLLRDRAEPTPVRGRTLALDEALFAADAVILDRPASRAVRYGAPGVPGIEMRWDGFEELGIWSKPGAEFLCIEPWRGFADPETFDGEFVTKPGLMLIPSGESRELWWQLDLLEA